MLYFNIDEPFKKSSKDLALNKENFKIVLS